MPDREQTDPNIVTAGMLYTALKEQGKDTNTQLRKIDRCVGEHGERLVRVETTIENVESKVDGIAPKVDFACMETQRIKGQWKALAYILGALAVGIVGWILREML